MTPEKKAELEGHWMARSMRWARERYLADRKYFLYHVLDAACMDVPLFGDEPYFQRPTPAKPVGGVLRWKIRPSQGQPGLKAVYTNVFIERTATVRRIEVCELQQLVDAIGNLFIGIAATPQEKVEILDKIEKWAKSYDDTRDDERDETSWAETVRLRSGSQG